MFRSISRPTQRLLQTKTRAPVSQSLSSHSFNSKSSNNDNNSALPAALRTFKELHGHLNIPASFVVPSNDDNWPTHTWGLHLGDKAAELRERSRKNEFPADDSDWEKIVLPALEQFFELNSHTDIPEDFVVPEGGETWPEASWGLKLGEKMATIRQSMNEKKEKFEKAPITDKQPLKDERTWTDKVMPSLMVFRHEFGHCKAPQHFVVPAESPWPPMAWGLGLGRIVGEVRAGKRYVEQATRDKGMLGLLGFKLGGKE